MVKKDKDTSIDQEDFAEDVPDVAVIKVKVKAGWRSKEEGSLVPLCIDIYPVTKGESLFTSVVIVVPNLGDCGNLELNSLKEFNQENIEEVE